MRRLKTYPALASVRLPASAEILDVRDRGSTQAPALVVSYDEADAATVERRFIVLRPGDVLHPAARFVASWRELDTRAASIACLFEIVDECPARLLGEAAQAWRLLRDAGFRERFDGAWFAPADIPAGHLSRDQIVAVSTLHEYGYGSVVHA